MTGQPALTTEQTAALRREVGDLLIAVIGRDPSSLRAIALEYGVSTTTVERWLVGNGLPEGHALRAVAQRLRERVNALPPRHCSG